MLSSKFSLLEVERFNWCREYLHSVNEVVDLGELFI
jgi:hypothetical protein